MALHITLENIHRLYDIDPSTKMDGIVIFRQAGGPNIDIRPNSRLFDGLLLGFMIKGSMTVQLHFLEYEVFAGDVAVLQPHLMMDTKSLSADAEVVTIGLSTEFLSGFPMMRDLVMSDQVRRQPIIRPTGEEVALQQESIILLERFYKKESSRHKTEMLQHLVATLVAMIAESYAVRQENNSVKQSRKHEIIDEFYVLISKYAHEQRTVSFYAGRLHLTPQYLSTFLKEHTGKSVLQWVDQIMVLHAQTLLKTTSLSIKQISLQLNFESTSPFCRSFKRITGVSPGAYRDKI